MRAAVHSVIAVIRMRFLVRRWRSGKRAGAYTASAATPLPSPRGQLTSGRSSAVSSPAPSLGSRYIKQLNGENAHILLTHILCTQKHQEPVSARPRPAPRPQAAAAEPRLAPAEDRHHLQGAQLQEPPPQR